MTILQPTWLAETPVRRLLAALAAGGIEARFVGGCVRDALLEIEIGDIDLATPARPETVMAALSAAGIKALPTGLAHGTVTAVIPPRIFEITTLRRENVETDGRHAVVAFDAGWAQDAARRDFTINALYLSPDGALFDPVGGQDDLAARRVRFVGDPATRIAEDVLRILRYYRFEARFGQGDGDAAARAACRAAAGKLPALSAERVSRELLRLIAGPDPVRVLKMMQEDGVLAAILPEATRLDRLAALVTPPALSGQRRKERAGAPANAQAYPVDESVSRTAPRLSPSPPAGKGQGGGLQADPILRLAASIHTDRTGAVALAERLRLAAKDRKRLAALAKPWPFGAGADDKAQRLALYRLGRGTFLDVVMLLSTEGTLSTEKARAMIRRAESWPVPVFPLGGADVTALGIAPGPRVGRLLAAVRRWWEEGDFAADNGACLAKLKELTEAGS